jgi:hypothetical protein
LPIDIKGAEFFVLKNTSKIALLRYSSQTISHPFEACNLMVFSIFTDLGNHHHHPFPELSFLVCFL